MRGLTGLRNTSTTTTEFPRAKRGKPGEYPKGRPLRGDVQVRLAEYHRIPAAGSVVSNGVRGPPP